MFTVMKLKIWHKMIIGITIPSFIAVLGGILTYGYINDINNRQGIVQASDDLKEQVLEVRRNAKNYLQLKSSSQLSSLQGSISSFSSTLSNTTLNTAVEIGMDQINILKESVQIYSGVIDELNESFKKEKMIINEVRAEGRKLESLVNTKKLAKELSTSFILRVRLLEKDYMLFRNDQSYRELSKVLSQIKNVMPYCYECTPYLEAVHTLFKINAHIDSLSKSLHAAGSKMEEITKITSGVQRQQINTFIAKTQNFTLAVLALLCTLGPLFVYKTSSFIAAPIKRLAEITRKISEGDRSLRAPLKEQDETYALALSFNTMLDTLQETQKSLEESLQLLNEKQAQLVESEKRASMGFLVAGVAHELNNPLNNISLRAELIKEETKEHPAEKLNSYVHDIVTESERAHKIINNLLDFARARKSDDMEKLDIVSIVKDSFNLVDNQLKVNNIKLNRSIPDNAYYVRGNRSKLEQILVSIINNAIQAMAGTGDLTVCIDEDNKDHNILVKISDTGKGIAETDLKNIFEPFYTTKPPGEGTGLGLAVSHTLVKEHNGDIEVESKIGGGTTFTIKLPIFKENA
jgi:signal transduction histidine kinase